MGSQMPVSSDRSRTYWTQTMERYFIDLMLEHMHRGNMIGHTFNKQAWTDMLAVFNAKFGSQYDKDVLKSRYTNLWKQFNDIKNILGQNGFCWDETRKMVVADDYVWDSYIKAQPDARPYKTKAVANFNDLCLIYGYTTADGRYSRSSHDIDNENDVQGGDGSGSLVTSNGERSRTDWTMDMDQYFIELMLNQQERGNKVDDTFSKQAWTDMLKLFNAKFGPQHGKRVLRHRYKKLCKYYSDVTVLLKQNGFSWDEKQQRIVAEDSVWDACIKAHPLIRSYRTKSLHNYRDLALIFRDTINIGNQSGDLLQDKDLEDHIVGVKAASERSRTYWTPPMDRYLIDLLLAQVNRGNRIGQTFIGQAWIDMVTSFNANFRSHHDKDVLKNRYKHLRRQYNDVKVLLEQSGFSWDETREMVTTEDHAWDAYIEAHPDARSYRVKTVPSYHKLCIIYGQDSSSGRYSHLARHVEANDENPVIRIGQAKDDRSLSNAAPVIDWTLEMDRCFIDLMLEQLHRGNKIDGAFDDLVWTDMITSFNEKLGLQCDRYVLQNQYICLMKHYIDISGLLNQNGFAWNDTRQIVEADDNSWEDCIKEHPNAISYRGKILGDYNDLSKIFGSGMMDENFIYHSLGTEIHNSPLGMETITSNERKRRSTQMPLDLRRSYKVQKGRVNDEIQEAFGNVANVVSKLVSRKADNNYVAIERAIDALQAVPDIDDDELLLDACDLLEDERKAKTFLALDVSLRKKWLLRKLDR